MLGIVDNKEFFTSLSFKKEGDKIYLIGKSVNDIASSEYLYSFHKVKNSPAPAFNLDYEYAIQQGIRKLIQGKHIQSAHDCADGGLFITLLESAMPNNLGFDIVCDKTIRKDAFLFGEAQSRVVVSVSKEKEEAFINLLKKEAVDFSLLGEVSKGENSIDKQKIADTKELKNKFDTALANCLN